MIFYDSKSSGASLSARPNEARRCRKTSFCFLYLRASLLASVGIKNKRCYEVASCWEQGLQGPLRRAEGKDVKRSSRRLRSSQSLPLSATKGVNQEVTRFTPFFTPQKSRLGVFFWTFKINAGEKKRNVSLFSASIFFWVLPTRK